MKAVVNKLFYPCDKIEQFVYDFIEGKLEKTVSFRFRAHISICPDCKEYVRLYQMTAKPQSFRDENPPHDELLDKTMDFLKHEGLLHEEQDEEGSPNQKGLEDGDVKRD